MYVHLESNRATYSQPVGYYLLVKKIVINQM